MTHSRNIQSQDTLGETGTDRSAAFLKVVEQDRKKLLWIAHRITRDRTEAEDILQEALLKAYKYLPQFRGDAQMGTWLCAIVKNTGRQWLRQRERRIFISLENVRNSDDDPIVLDLVDPERNPEQTCAQKELSNLLLTEVKALNAVCRSTIEMCALEGKSHCEAATELGVSVASVKSRMFRGKRMLLRAVCRRTGGAETFVRATL